MIETLKLTQCPNPSVRFDRATHASTPTDAVDTGTHLRSALVWLCRTRLVHSDSSFSLLFPHPVGSRLSPSPPYRTPPSSFGARLLARLLVERTHIPSFFLPPLKLAQGAHHGRRSPHLVTRQCFSSMAKITFCTKAMRSRAFLYESIMNLDGDMYSFTRDGNGCLS